MKSRMKDTLLLVGNADSDRSNLHTIFESNYYLLEAESAAQGILLLEQNSPCIAAVLADIPLNDRDSLRSLVEACHPETENEIPVICVISPTGTGQREEIAFLLGVADVVHKPYTTLSIRRRVQVLVDLYAHRWHLEKLVEDQSKAIRGANETILDALSAIIEHRSTESGNHVLRIRRFTGILLEELAQCYPEYALDEAAIDSISSAATLHDIGKISIPDAILNKPGKLTAEEFEVMKTHTTLGSELVEHLASLGDIMFLRYAYNISLYHHERFDGKGYPAGLAGDQIPICAQVVGLADAFDALTTPRVYKPAFAYDQACNMILNGECGVFSPKLLECFKRVRSQMIALAKQYADGYSPKSDAIRVPLPDPLHQHVPLDSLQLNQLKYQSLLHHLNDTVVEIDIDARVYHVVYNPNPDFVYLFSNSSYDELAQKLVSDTFRPASGESMMDIQAEMAQSLFKENQRKFSYPCQIYSPSRDRYLPYEIILLRVNTENPHQRLILSIFHELDENEASPSADTRPDTAFFYGLSGAWVCCQADDSLTIVSGANTLLPLTGCTPLHIDSEFGGSLLALVLPEDREKLLTMTRELQSGGRSGECELWLRRDGTDPVWVLAKARRATAGDGTEYIYMTLTDISGIKASQIQLTDTLKRNQLIIDQSEGILFEWDLKTNVFTCSEKWENRFGYSIGGKVFGADGSAFSHVHPDDLPLLRSQMKKALAGQCSEYADIRIANSEGRYLWSRLRGKAYHSADGASSRILGMIYNIDDLKRSALSMKKQAQQDMLTGLLNKASAQQFATDYLENRPAEELAAMILLDLDNFKGVNDTCGHLYGDAVLTQVGTTLRNLFRSQDIIGRVGGDEFLILLKGIPGVEVVKDRCELLVDTFREQFQKLLPGKDLSVSVGAALAPSHGSGYSDLFLHADEALYVAKHGGKNQYHLYVSADSLQSISAAVIHSTRIDSDEQPTLNNETIMRYIFHRLYESRNVEATIDEVLSFIGTHFNVSRVYIFENNDDNTACSNTFEWCNVGIEPEKENLQDLSYLTDLAGWPDVYKESGVLYCPDIQELEPRFREIVEPQGIKSMLHCAIMDEGVFRGYVGFDDCNANFLWTQGQIDTLKFLAEVLAVFLIKLRSAEK